MKEEVNNIPEACSSDRGNSKNSIKTLIAPAARVEIRWKTGLHVKVSLSMMRDGMNILKEGPLAGAQKIESEF